jgi:hypothetical protein
MMAENPGRGNGKNFLNSGKARQMEKGGWTAAGLTLIIAREESH